MAEMNGGQLAARQLAAEGIDTITWLATEPPIEVLSGAVEAGMKVVNCRHEVSAGLMASAWGFVSGKPGVCVVGSGPALTNALTPLYVASESAMPLVNRTTWAGLSWRPSDAATSAETMLAVVAARSVVPTTMAMPRRVRRIAPPAAIRPRKPRRTVPTLVRARGPRCTANHPTTSPAAPAAASTTAWARSASSIAAAPSA